MFYSGKQLHFGTVEYGIENLDVKNMFISIGTNDIGKLTREVDS